MEDQEGCVEDIKGVQSLKSENGGRAANRINHLKISQSARVGAGTPLLKSLTAPMVSPTSFAATSSLAFYAPDKIHSATEQAGQDAAESLVRFVQRRRTAQD